MSEKENRLEKVKADIASGKLTYPQIQKRLAAVIKCEYKKEGGPNIDLVNACEDLLWRLGTDNAPFVTHEDQYKEAIRSRIEASHRTRQIKKPVLRFVATLVVVVLLLGGAEMFLHREWLEQTDTDDQQQHIVQGYTVDPELIEKAIADESKVRKFDTTDYQEVRNFLGFDLPYNIFISNWEPEHYYLSVQPIFIEAVVLYRQVDDQQPNLTLDLKIYTSVENAFISFEQEQEGIMEPINETSIYFSNNVGNNAAVWMTSNCVFRLRSIIEEDILKEIVQQLIGGKEYE